MSEDTLPPDFTTRPAPNKVKKEGPHTVLVRTHENDWAMLKVMLKRDELSFQKFVSICSRAYMDGDPNLIRCLRTYRELELVPRDQVERSVFSNRERAEIYAELEREQGKKESE